MVKIGITGGIGSGKSTVARLFSLLDVPVYIADDESKRLAASSPVIRKQLTELFGSSIYTPEGLNKQRLASLIFSNPEYLQAVNAIIHPVVREDFLRWAGTRQTPLCAIESAILFEAGFERTVDYTLMVWAPVETRIDRVCRRGDTSREEIMRRIGSQLPDETKQKRSDFIILNDDTHALLPQVTDFLKRMTLQA